LFGTAHSLGDAYPADTRLVWLPDARPSRVAYWGAPQTIEVMSKAALEGGSAFEVRRLVEALCEGLDSKDYTSEYLAALFMVLQRTRYMRDPRTVELVRSPRVLAQQIMAGRRPSVDCDDMAALLAAMILAMGGKAEFVTVAFVHQFYEGRRQFSHVYVRALEPRNNQWIVLDPVAAEKTGQMLARVKAFDTWPITS